MDFVFNPKSRAEYIAAEIAYMGKHEDELPESPIYPKTRSEFAMFVMHGLPIPKRPDESDELPDILPISPGTRPPEILS